MAKLSDNIERRQGIEILHMRASEVEAAAAAVKAEAQGMLDGDTDGQFMDDTAMDTAVVGVRDKYYALGVPGLGDVTDLYDITLP